MCSETDDSSAVSILVRERGGYDLMPEMGFQPVNKYLPPRQRRDATVATPRTPEAPAAPSGSLADRFFAWADKALTG